MAITPQQVAELIGADKQLAHLEGIARQSMGTDPAHDLHHCRRVAFWTLRLLESLRKEFSPRNAVAAALLHDLVNVDKTSNDRSKASEWSAQAAQPLLLESGFSVAATNDICRAIVDHSFSRGRTPESDLGRALQDADRLDALGALGIYRTIVTGVKMGANFFDPVDPFAAERPLDDRRYTIDHFFTKLLKLPESFQTNAGKQEAKRRVVVMESLLRSLAAELSCPSPV